MGHSKERKKMKSKFFIFALAISFLVTCGILFAHEHDAPTQAAVTPEFLRIKNLAGAWKGTADHEGKKENVTVEYQVTSGGSAVIEKLMPGTPQEMVSLYYEEKGKLRMTHYCMLGNRPTLELKKSGPKGLSFELAKNSGIDIKKEVHMHALKLSFDQDKLTQEWTSFKGGKPQDKAVFNLTRVS